MFTGEVSRMRAVSRVVTNNSYIYGNGEVDMGRNRHHASKGNKTTQ